MKMDDSYKTFKMWYKQPLDPTGEAFTIKVGRSVKEARVFAEKALRRNVKWTKHEEI
jgi:hypothetical protein